VGAAGGGGVVPLLEPLLLEPLLEPLDPELLVVPELLPEVERVPELEPLLAVPELLPVPLLDLEPLEPPPASSCTAPPDDDPLDELEGSAAAPSSPEASTPSDAPLTLPALGATCSVVPPYGPPSGSPAPLHPATTIASSAPQSVIEQVDECMVPSSKEAQAAMGRLQRLRAASAPKAGNIAGFSNAGGSIGC
jgi:hypothetical protein